MNNKIKLKIEKKVDKKEPTSTNPMVMAKHDKSEAKAMEKVEELMTKTMGKKKGCKKC